MVNALATPLRAAVSIVVPEERDRTEQDLRAQVQQQGRKFTKVESFYIPVALLPPGVWFYECATCAVFEPGPRTCALVEGNIEPYAWCPLWVPRPDDPPFSWLARMVQP